MDEHITLTSGRVGLATGDIVDDNKNDLTWWTAKHNGYASREVLDTLNFRYGIASIGPGATPQIGMQAGAKRWIKENIYWRLPLGLRPLIYFCYRYFIRVGFLDGFPGLIFHVLQGFWYRFLVDAKLFEIERRAEEQGMPVEEVVRSDYKKM